jgi:hypothetical protein
METISLRDALTMMDNGKPFHLKAVAFDKTKKKGGHFIELKSVVKVGARYSLKDNDMISVKTPGGDSHPYPIHTHLITEYNHNRILI